MIRTHAVLVCRVVYAIPVGLVLLLIATIYNGYVLKFQLPRARAGGPDSNTAVGELLLFHSLFVPLVVSYLRCVLTDPGAVPRGWAAGIDREDLRDGQRWCEHCNQVKPERAHHCSLCRRCVLKMDHHCPWVGNCVGFGNYKFFYLFVLYGCLGCSVVAATMDPGIDALFHNDGGDGGARRAPPTFTILISYVFSIAVALALLFLGGFHTWLSLKNLTTLEMHGRDDEEDGHSRRSPYHLGALRNWESVFGTRKLLWFLPIAPDRPGGGVGTSRTAGVQWAHLSDEDDDEGLEERAEGDEGDERGAARRVGSGSGDDLAAYEAYEQEMIDDMMQVV